LSLIAKVVKGSGGEAADADLEIHLCEQGQEPVCG
jgi:hypothetical protein